MRILSRYATIPSVLDMLINRRITLVDPSTWSDRNDRETLDRYARATPERRVFAYCMAEGNETAHHWQVFADGGNGARIRFNRDRLLAAASLDVNVVHDPVSYVQWREIGPGMCIDRLPFLKRSVFRFENEYRIVAAVTGIPDEQKGYDLAIPLDCITSIYLSGTLPAPLFETLRDLIGGLPDCNRIKVWHSGLLQNVHWSRSLDRALSAST